MMKATRRFRTHVRDRVAMYARRVNVKVPMVACTTEEVRRLPRLMTGGSKEDEMARAGMCFGAYFRVPHMVYVNLGEHDDLFEVESTIIHEIVHARFRTLGHGDAFDRMCDVLMLGGRFPPRWIFNDRQLRRGAEK